MPVKTLTHCTGKADLLPTPSAKVEIWIPAIRSLFKPAQQPTLTFKKIYRYIPLCFSDKPDDHDKSKKLLHIPIFAATFFALEVPLDDL